MIKGFNRISAFWLAMMIFMSGLALPQQSAAEVYAETTAAAPTGNIYFSADADGRSPIEHIGGFDSVWVNGTAYGDGVTDQELYLYVALYNDGLTLERADVQAVNAKDFETDFSIEIKDLTKSSVLSAKAFLWTEEMTPAAEYAECKSGIKPQLKGVYEAYNDIDIVFDGNVESQDEISEIIWQRADSRDGEYAAIEGSAGMTYMTTAKDSGKWLKAKVTVGEESYETEPKQIEAISAAKTYDGTNTKIGTNEKTPEEYKFTVDGVEFILLDVTDDDDSKFLVMTNKRIGVRRYSYFIKYSTEAGYDKSKNNTNNSIAATAVDMAAFLNDKDNVNVIIGDGEPTNKDGAWKYGTTGEINGDYSYGASPQKGYSSQAKSWTQLPSSIKSHINNYKYWICEPLNSVFEGNTFAIQGGIMPLSQSEVKKYSERIGLWEEYNVSNDATKLQTTWWTRSPSSGGATYAIEWGALGKSAGRVGHTNGNGGCGVRPAFYLDKDFFLDTKLDLREMGKIARSEILGAYTRQELLSAGYTKEDLSTVAEKAAISVPTETSPEEFEISVAFDAEMPVGTEYLIEYSLGDAKGTQKAVTDAKVYNKTVSVKPQNVKNGVSDYSVSVKRGDETLAQTSGTAYISEPYQAQFLDKYTLKGYCGLINSADTGAMMYSDGAGMVRQSVRWEFVEKTEKGVYDWTSADRVIPNIINSGIEPLMILAIGNKLYTGSNENIVSTKEGIDAFVNYAKAIAERYPKVKYYEVLNEPNSQSPLDVALLTKVVERELHKINPDIVVLGGSMADASQKYLATLYRFGEYDYIDGVSNHPYTYYYGLDADDDNSVAPRIDRVNAVSENYGGFKESCITEIGWTTTGTEAQKISDQHDQAVNLIKQFAIADSRGASMDLTYRHIDNGKDSTNAESGFGVRDYYKNSKESNLSGRAYFNKMRGAQYLGKLPLTADGDIGYLYIKEKKPLAVMWHKDGTSTQEFEGEKLTVYDMFGNVTATDVSTITLTDDPIYVEGFSDKWFNTALNAEVNEKLSYYLESIGQSARSELFSQVSANAEAVSKKDTIASEEEASGYIDANFAVVSSVIALYDQKQISQQECSALLSMIEELGEILTNYYSLTADSGNSEIKSDKVIKEAETLQSEREATAVGGRLPYAETMLRMARRYMQNASEVLNADTENVYKAGIVKAWDRHALEIAKMAKQWIPEEKITSGNILIQVPTGDASLEYDKSGSVDAGVYNYSSSDIDGTLTLVDASGNTVGSSDIELKAGGTGTVAVTATVPSGGADESFVTAVITQKEDNNEICRSSVMVMKQTERLADTISPAPVFKENTDAADIFKLGINEYILLDTFDTDKSKFMVLSKKSYNQTEKFYSTLDSLKFDPADSNSIAYTLNQNRLKAVGTQSMVNCIDFDHYYLTEGSSYIADVPYDYQTKAGIAVLSASEVIKYADKIGMNDGNFSSSSISSTGYYWMLRTGRNKHDAYGRIHAVNVNYSASTQEWSFTMTTYASNVVCRVRPLFYLNKEFFTKNHVTVSNMGDNVKKAVRESYTKEELKAANYTDEELTALGFE